MITYSNGKPRKVTRSTVGDALVGLTPFNANSMRGRRNVITDREHFGQLAPTDRALFTEDAELAFVVWSYATPIAWVRFSGEIVIPDFDTTATTRQHRNYCRRFLRTGYLNEVLPTIGADA